MSFLYFDCFSGVSGDMIISALLDCGASFEHLNQVLAKLPIAAKISHRRKIVSGIRCTSFDVLSEGAPLRHLADIEKIIADSSLSAIIKSKSLHVFNRLAVAESTVHGTDPGLIHFHEIGAVDTIVDIVGTFLCLESLGIDEIYTSPLPWPAGFIDISHGRYPLPAPATSLLLSGYPCVFSDAGIELVTPTGAALITTIATPWSDSRPFIPSQIAYGAGDYIRPDKVPNLLRVVKAEFMYPEQGVETIAVLETEVDDVNPEIFTHLHHLFTSDPSVLDFFTTPVQMKKNRPGTLITLLTRPEDSPPLARRLMLESGSLGVRHRLQSRYTVPRTESQVKTPWGPVRIKIARFGPDSIRIKPEFDDIQAIAVHNDLPIYKVYAVVSNLAAAITDLPATELP